MPRICQPPFGGRREGGLVFPTGWLADKCCRCVVHQVQFEVIERQPMSGGPARPHELWESGRKDTVIAYPDEITRIKAKFELAGLYVWHCHILEQEDNEMMRPIRVLLPPTVFMPLIAK